MRFTSFFFLVVEHTFLNFLKVYRVTYVSWHRVVHTNASNRQLAKLLSGFVTGQITVAKVVVTVAAQSLAWGK